MTDLLHTYYARRAAEYERVYDKPERQADLAAMRRWLPPHFAGRRVLEVACGTGWWQERRLDDGSLHRVLKNFHDEAELRLAVAAVDPGASVTLWRHFWALVYRR